MATLPYTRENNSSASLCLNGQAAEEGKPPNPNKEQGHEFKTMDRSGSDAFVGNDRIGTARATHDGDRTARENGGQERHPTGRKRKFVDDRTEREDKFAGRHADAGEYQRYGDRTKRKNGDADNHLWKWQLTNDCHWPEWKNSDRILDAHAGKHADHGDGAQWADRNARREPLTRKRNGNSDRAEREQRDASADDNCKHVEFRTATAVDSENAG